MSVWRLALTRRWLGALALTALFALACWGLSQWQFARRAEAQAAIHLLNANYDQSPVAIDRLLASSDEYDASEKWRPVTVTGTYWAGGVVYVRNRPNEAGIGFEQLVPLTTANGTTFIVDRGWVAANGDNSLPLHPPSIPAGQVTVVARLIPSEEPIAGRDAPAGQIATIDLHALDGRDGGAGAETVYTGWYGKLDAENPSGPAGLPWEKPVLDEGPHLSYALQWWVFALMGFIGYGWALRKEARGDVAPPRKPVRRMPTDEDVEDAALDATRVR